MKLLEQKDTEWHEQFEGVRVVVSRAVNWDYLPFPTRRTS